MVFIGNKSNHRCSPLPAHWLAWAARQIGRVAAFCCSTLFFSGIILTAQAEPNVESTNLVLERKAQEISETIMSPFCPGLTLSSCTSGQAQELRAEIRTRVLSGENPESLKNELVTKYGDTITGLPKPGSIGQTAPMFFVLIGVAVLIFGVRTLTRRSSPQPEKQASTTGESLKAVEEELRKRLKS